MKQKLRHVMIALIAIAIPSLTYAQSQEAAGTYNGTLDVSLAEIPAGSSTENVYITIEDETHITLKIKDFKFGVGEESLEIGDIIIPNVELRKEEDVITIQPADTQLNIPDIGIVNVHLNQSTIVNDKLELTLDVKPVIVPLDVIVTFSGTKVGGSGIHDIATAKPTIYYNSATSALIVKGAEYETYIIYDVAGVQTLSGVLNTEEINASSLSKGMYLINIKNTTLKFIKK